MNSYQIATIPGDGIGKEVVPESVKVLDIVAAKCGFQLKYKNYNYSCEYFKEHGKMMAENGLDRLRDSDGIFWGQLAIQECLTMYHYGAC